MSNLKIREDGDMTIKDVRLSYAHLFKAKAFEEGKDAKFSVTAMIPKDTHAKEIAKLREIFDARQKAKFKKRLPSDRLCLRDGDESGKEEYAGMWTLSLSESTRPTLLDKDGKTALAQEDDKLYSGCYANILFRLWDQDHQKYGKRVNGNLLAVQFMRHGEKFSGVQRPAADECFDDEGDDDGDGDGFGDDD